MSFKIGVDGGGSKTELILTDSAGEIVARHTAPGCNPSHVGADQACEILTAALNAVRGQHTVSHTQLYMAGSPATWRDIAAQLKNFGTVTAAPDSPPVLELATGGAPGLVLHAGTGSFVAARGLDGSVHYAGGLGWKLGDPGSAFDLGRRGIARALLELQGWAKPTPLGEALKVHAGLDDATALTRFFYRAADANACIAGFAPRVVELAQQGCGPAQAALACTLTDLVEQARLVTDKLFGSATTPCGVSGPLLNSPPAVYALKALAATHGWAVEYRFITEPPIEGVRRLLARST
jgi:N-acetylglucosamine kinase-like BadF-type ATPase